MLLTGLRKALVRVMQLLFVGLWKAMLTAEVRCAGTLNDPASERPQKQMAASVVLADARWLQGPRPSGQPSE